MRRIKRNDEEEKNFVSDALKKFLPNELEFYAEKTAVHSAQTENLLGNNICIILQ